MRRKGEVVRVAWIPDDGKAQRARTCTRGFLKSCVRHEDPTPEGNLGAWLHGKLDEKPEPHD